MQRGESEKGTAAQEAHDKIDMGKIQRDAQEKSDREPAAKRKRERVEKALDQRTEQDKDIRDDDANANVHGVNDQIANARWAAQKAKNQESRQAKDEPQADQANQSLISEILKQQERVLQMSQNGTVNQMEAQAVMAQLSARIDQLIAKQREAATKSLHMDTLNTMLGTQQDFAADSSKPVSTTPRPARSTRTTRPSRTPAAADQPVFQSFQVATSGQSSSFSAACFL